MRRTKPDHAHRGRPMHQTDIRRHGHHARLLAAGFALGLLAVACGDANGADPATDSDPSASEGDPSAADAGDSQLSIAIASFDLAVGEDQRLIAGVLASDRSLLAHGDVTFQLGYLGDEAGGETELTQETTASYLPIPGMEPEGDEDAPRFLDGEPGNGVYAGRVDLDEPGFWGLRVIAELEDGEVMEGQATFQVLEEHQVHTTGDPAPHTENLTAADAEAGEIAPVAIDSRAGGEDGMIPDQHLHDAVISEELEAGRPLVVAVTTPVYCVSRFCGPLTESLAEMAPEYEDTATFVHLEVWKDHEEQELNQAAADWILPSTGAGGNEPWVFLVDGDGTIVHRWDNVLDVAELEAALAEL